MRIFWSKLLREMTNCSHSILTTALEETVLSNKWQIKTAILSIFTLCKLTNTFLSFFIICSACNYSILMTALEETVLSNKWQIKIAILSIFALC